MPKNYTWHLTCETHDIDEWTSCQTTGNDEVMSQRYIEEYAQVLKADNACSRSNDNFIELTSETDVE